MAPRVESRTPAQLCVSVWSRGERNEDVSDTAFTAWHPVASMSHMQCHKHMERFTWSRVLRSGESPPCTQSTRPSINACGLAETHFNDNYQGRAAYTATRAQAYACPSHREREVVEHLCTVPPGIGIAILPLTFIVEAIHLHVARST